MSNWNNDGDQRFWNFWSDFFGCLTLGVCAIAFLIVAVSLAAAFIGTLAEAHLTPTEREEMRQRAD